MKWQDRLHAKFVSIFEIRPKGVKLSASLPSAGRLAPLSPLLLPLPPSPLSSSSPSFPIRSCRREIPAKGGACNRPGGGGGLKKLGPNESPSNDSEPPAGGSGQAAYPFRRACTHTCTPSHVHATHGRNYFTQYCHIFFGNYLILRSQKHRVRNRFTGNFS